MDPTTATMTPLSSGRHRSPKAKRRRHAAPQPLGDVTNLLIPTNPTTSPLPSDSACCSMSSSLTPVSKPSSAAASEERSFVKSTISTVYTSTRRKTTEKIPFRAGTARSCPPPDTVARTNRKTSMAQGTRPISSSAPCHRSKKDKSTRMPITSFYKPVLPEDFVKKQRAYFEEIDAFELPEEEASGTDLE
ncbi:uncharacterized protein LOC102702436 isoform X2 [Oryza brachyantha]|uniref:uncharacterized protein LOC102702436 isoform X2 n=1 Tax=Oryza brachyantha TaxID=4533 RepID=UPI0003EAC8CA|nr:uncharacterized protein LOC102702436 isoform X2 [Oryza brachyantha]